MSPELLPAIRPARVAWNKDRIIGQKRPLQPKHVWSIRVSLEMAGDLRILRCSTWPSTASFAATTWSRCRSATSSPLVA
jgi:hypothetical protein